MNRPLSGMRPALKGAVLALLIAPVSAGVIVVERTTDAFDVSGGTVVTSNSPLRSGSIQNMFGANGSTPLNFSVWYGVGHVHAVQCQTSTTISLRSFSLYAGHDGGTRDRRYRGFTIVRLFGFNTGSSTYDLLFEFDTANPYGDSVSPAGGLVETNGDLSELRLAANLAAPYATDRFRAEFVQAGEIDPNAKGPRIRELDGFTSDHPDPISIPEPGVTLLALLGWVGLLRRRR
mgnify:CR=1 FL=1